MHSNRDYQKILKNIYNQLLFEEDFGTVASYIPELAKVSPKKLGVYLQTNDGEGYAYGDAIEKFSIQSISKVFSLSIALSILGPSLWKRVGVEPSGTAFNSIVQLEYEKGIPRNPFINPGAIVIADILVTYLKNPKQDFLNYVRSLAGEDTIDYDLKVANSEKITGYRNAAHINMLKSFGNIQNDVDEVLDFYYHQCSLSLTCKELAQAFNAFANQDKPFLYNGITLSKSQVKRMNAIMLSCGFYDESGEFAFRVGLSGKSGVGGGIAAILPRGLSIAVWSPRLNKKGNSYMGMRFLEEFTTETDLSIF
ncbi:glutaminase [Flammeovirga kamogawensis]|uniref:Glutaminase n=1 Tax=Flammeovirga kamogawensis TaxID=373891 RepID=A0ABX8GZK4_9BACT|nr:glutaminase [Flammeovirga kamogawensis]MBB6459426.1 glutaminase [Flammeovirga kamogawensis]QWG08981.1 glutaminase [Flammeovirga kamogawensis]TRX67271.1 glutaminase [Flammeovirga kamogawensis]